MSAPDYPLQTYRPGLRVDLAFRFEDYGATDTPAIPKVIGPLRGKAPIKPLKIQPNGNGGFLLIDEESQNASNANGGVQPQSTSKDGRTQHIDGVIPKSAELRRNGIRQADQLTLEFRYALFPFDPRAIRSCGVELYIGTYTDDQFQKGTTSAGSGSESESGSDKKAISLNVIPDTSETGLDNRRFVGWADSIEIDFDGEGEPIVRMECVDNTRQLIDTEYFPGVKIDKDIPVDQAVAKFLSNYPVMSGMTVAFYPVGTTPIPKIKEAVEKKSQTDAIVKNIVSPSANGGGSNKITILDYLTDVLGLLSLNIRVEFNTIIIQGAKTLYDRKFPYRPDFQYSTRVLPSGESFAFPTFIYGRNVETLTVTRNYAKYSPTCIQVNSYSTRNKALVIVRFPDKDDKKPRPKKVLPGNIADQKWFVYKATRDLTIAACRSIAQMLYENYNRNELVVRFTTHNLSSFGGGNREPDALDLRAGDPIQVSTNRDIEGVTDTPGKIENTFANGAAAYLKGLGYEQAIADQYEKAISSVGYPNFFSVRSVGMSWDGDEGDLSIDVEAVNFIEVSMDRDQPEATKQKLPPSPSKLKKPMSPQPKQDQNSELSPWQKHVGIAPPSPWNKKIGIKPVGSR